MSRVQTNLYDNDPPEKGDWIENLQPGQAIQGIFAANSVAERKKKDGSSFLSLDLQDRTGHVAAVAWDHAHLASSLSAGTVIHVRGTVQTYNERPQVKVTDLEIVERETPREYFLPVSSQGKEILRARLADLMDSITTPYLKTLLAKVFEEGELLERYLEAPAAKLRHQAYIGGLAEHSLNMAEHAIYCSRYYPDLKGDLLVTAAILHDIGKIFEYQVDMVIDYSDEGRLEGHIVMGERLVRRVADSITDFPQVEKVHLSHLILSHQGRLEYGSPVTPKSLEAVVLYVLDLLDSRVASFRDIRESYRGELRTWSDYDRLDERFWYLGESKEEGSGAVTDKSID